MESRLGSRSPVGGDGSGHRSGLPTRSKVAALTIGVVAAVGIFAASQKSSGTTDSTVSPSTPASSPSASG